MIDGRERNRLAKTQSSNTVFKTLPSPLTSVPRSGKARLHFLSAILATTVIASAVLIFD